jgi:Ca2+-binding EF-hand superfamily protein
MCCLWLYNYVSIHFVGTDPENVIRNAFACFDEEGTGTIHEDKYVHLLYI